MTEFRFIHTSDLHLGQRFASIPEPPDGNIRGRLNNARHEAIGRIAQAARDHGAGDVLVAGDVFDTPTPSAGVLRKALAAMGEDQAIRWWLMPGNHDNLSHAEQLWDEITRDSPENVHAVTQARPIALRDDTVLLPAPVGFRSAGRDLTEDLPRMRTAEGHLRLGLAHGGVVDFAESGANIPPDRDRTAGLDYLGLGDWHGRREIGPRVQYSGSPEQTGFKHSRRGVCLAVTLTGPGAAPQVAEVETGAFLWLDRELPLLAEQDAAAAFEATLPEGRRQDMLLRVTATGRTTLPGRAALRAAAARLGAEFAHFEGRFDALATDYAAADLDEIDRAGALRLAAERLMAEAGDDALAAEERDIAAAALNRLYAYAREDGA